MFTSASLKSGMETPFPMFRTGKNYTLHPVVRAMHGLPFLALMLIPVHYMSKFLPTGYAQDLFNIGREANLPTFFACFSWMLVSAASLVAFFADPFVKPVSKTRWLWLFIAAAFFFACIDEFVQLHEHIDDIWQSIGGVSSGSGKSIPDWNVVYTPPMLVLTAVGGGFAWLQMAPVKHARAFLASGIVFLALAIAAEYLEASPTILAAIQANAFMAKTHILWVLEETFENLGAVFIAISIARFADYAIRCAIPQNAEAVAALDKQVAYDKF